MFIGAGIFLVIIIGIAAFFMRTSATSGVEPGSGSPETTIVPWDASRIFLYALSFAGLVAVLYAVSGLAATIAATLTQHSNALTGSSGGRDRTSYYVAALVVGLPLWWFLWRQAQARAARSEQERMARERLWYLAGIFAVIGVVALFGARTLLADLLSLPGVTDKTATVRDALFAGARTLVWGTVWLAYARLGWRERSPRARDEAHDLAVYVVSAFSLGFLVAGLYIATRQIVGAIIAPPVVFRLDDTFWSTWGDILAWILVGGFAWSAIWRYDLARAGRRRLRVVYLYLVTGVAAFAVIGASVDGLDEILRRAFGYQATPMWGFLRDALPPLLIGAAIWAYHWKVIRRQSALSGEPPLVPGAIPSPRHLAVTVLSLAGLVMTAVAWTSLVWLVLDAVFQSGAAHSGGDWWRGTLSAGLAAGLVGGAIWLPAWSIWQRAATVDPQRERTMLIRRRFLGLIVLAGALVALGFAVAVVWTIIQPILGGAANAGTADQVLKNVVAVIVAGGIALYHYTIYRGDQRFSAAEPARLKVLAFVEPGGEAMLAHLQQSRGRSVTLAGRLLRAAPTTSDPARVTDVLGRLDAEERAEGVLMILGPEGATLYPYARTSSASVASEPETEQPLPGGMVDDAENGASAPV